MRSGVSKMSETLWAVLIGGGITILGSVVASLLQHSLNNRRFKREKADEVDKHNRGRKEEAYYRISSYQLLLTELLNTKVNNIDISNASGILTQSFAEGFSTITKDIVILQIYGGNNAANSLLEVQRKLNELGANGTDAVVTMDDLTAIAKLIDIAITAIRIDLGVDKEETK